MQILEIVNMFLDPGFPKCLFLILLEICIKVDQLVGWRLYGQGWSTDDKEVFYQLGHRYSTCDISVQGKERGERRWHVHAVPAFGMCRASLPTSHVKFWILFLCSEEILDLLFINHLKPSGQYHVPLCNSKNLCILPLTAFLLLLRLLK